MAASTKVDINGTEYTVTPNAWGWSVTRAACRSYEVFADEVNGGPCRCSCPDQVYRKGCCKHMKAIIEQVILPSYTPPEEV